MRKIYAILMLGLLCLAANIGYAFSDNFTGTTIDTAKWSISTASGATITQTSDTLLFNNTGPSLDPAGWTFVVCKSVPHFSRAAGTVITFKFKLNSDNGYFMGGFYPPSATTGDPNGSPALSAIFRAYGGSLRVYENGADTAPPVGYSIQANSSVWHYFRIELNPAGGAVYKWNQGGAGPVVTLVDTTGSAGKNTTEDMILLFSMYRQDGPPQFQIDDVNDDPGISIPVELSDFTAE